MRENFQTILSFTFIHEGIHSNDPCDPGGDTKYGIARLMHPEITDEQWANWSIADSEAMYLKMYWCGMGCDSLPYPLDMAVFDTAVNPGPGACHHMLGLAAGDWKELINLRRSYYQARVLKDPTKQKYLKGWLNRCDDLEILCNNK